ncbi:MAG TPA: TIGR04076 family protein [Candidatus Saccharimonadales bacterium]
MKYLLNDISVTTIGNPNTFNCNHEVGEGFVCKGEMLMFNKDTTQFSHYVLATLMPYIAAKQRVHDPNDWMQFEQDIACPDPLCSARFRFSITGSSAYEYNANKVKNKV